MFFKRDFSLCLYWLTNFELNEEFLFDFNPEMVLCLLNYNTMIGLYYF